MKRITTLLLAAVFAFGWGGVAHADGIDIKVKGQWDFAFGWGVNTVFKDSVHGQTGTRDDDKFIARHRVRTQINFIASETLQGVLMFEIGDLNWGRGYNATRAGRSTGGGLDADGVNIETKRAYLDWIIPNTDVSVRMGIQGLKLPSTPMGSSLFDADVAGIVVQSPVTDMISVTGFWIRPFDYNANDDTRSLADEVDVFGLLLPITGDGWSVTPWGMYGFIGANSGIYDYLFRDGGNPSNTVVAKDSTHAWWVGTHFELAMLNPLVLNVEAIYGQLHRADLTGLELGGSSVGSLAGVEEEIGTRGWFLAATLDYKLDWATPGIFAWWASGDKEDANKTGKYGRMPVLGNDGGSFAPTSFGFSGTYGIGSDTVVAGTGTGTWGVGIQLADLSFIEDLSHTLRVAYYRGTNDHQLVKNGIPLKWTADTLYLTDKDSVIEVNFDHEYKIYENLTAVLELGYLHLNADKDTWRASGNTGTDEHENAWKAQVNLRYNF